MFEFFCYYCSNCITIFDSFAKKFQDKWLQIPWLVAVYVDQNFMQPQGGTRENTIEYILVLKDYVPKMVRLGVLSKQIFDAREVMLRLCSG